MFEAIIAGGLLLLAVVGGPLQPGRDRRRGSVSSAEELNAAPYPASQQIPWLHEQFVAALAAWEQNPTDTVRRMELCMIAVVMHSLTTQQKCWVTDKDMPWPSPADPDPTTSRHR